MVLIATHFRDHRMFTYGDNVQGMLTLVTFLLLEAEKQGAKGVQYPPHVNNFCNSFQNIPQKLKNHKIVSLS